MCGRYNLTTQGVEIANSLLAALHDEDWQPHYNIPPTTRAPVLRRALDGSRHLHLLRWGLLPPWAKHKKLAYRMINARSETLVEKPAFRVAAERRRCLVPMTGYYEWKKLPDAKQAFHIAHQERTLLLAAGLWEQNDALETRSFTILTTAAPPPFDAIHDRMPLFVPASHHELWLNHGATNAEDALRELHTCHVPLEAWPVSNNVGNVHNDTPTLIDPIGPQRVLLP